MHKLCKGCHLKMIKQPLGHFTPSVANYTSKYYERLLSPAANPYIVLGVDRSASPKEVKEAYLRLSKLYHPDVTRNTQDGRFLQVSNAYKKILEDFKESELNTNSGEFDNKQNYHSGQPESYIVGGFSTPNWEPEKTEDVKMGVSSNQALIYSFVPIVILITALLWWRDNQASEKYQKIREEKLKEADAYAEAIKRGSNRKGVV